VVQIGGVQVRPGDIVMADVNGVVVIPLDQAAEVLRVSQKIGERERDIVAKIKEGISFLEVDRESGYDKMLEKR
jgi:regulator of RNase E activity RraA